MYNTSVNNEVFRLDFVWKGPVSTTVPPSVPPVALKAGQFFMIKPKRSAVFLGRPISAAKWRAESNTVSFLIARRGKGTLELASMQSGEEAELTGPLGNAWTDFLPTAKNIGEKPIALIGGGIGVAPLLALLCEKSGHSFDLYAGFKKGFETMEERSAFLGPALDAREIIIASEDGKTGHKGRIPDFFEPDKYAAVCACGPEPMLKTVAIKCKDKGVPCFVSLERRMACGVGACLGCTVKTINGNRRCCADGPIFNAEEVFFDE
jgi:NAD(P)H-flavin reductase